jgi:uncharacterized protein (DUF2252 family)
MISPARRAEHLRATRNWKMARSAHAYVRGSTTKFYEWLDASPAGAPTGPAVWICGDCHLGNLGPLADARGRVAVQIRDLDQTVIGNPAHDLIRLGLSLASAVRGCDLPGVTTARTIESLMAGYESALGDDLGEEGERELRPRRVRGLLRKSAHRHWRHLAAERLETIKPELPLGKRFWKLTPDERIALTGLFQEDGAHALLTSLQSRDADDPITLVDAAYWMKGCSSLGRLRFAAMVKIGEGRNSSLALVDLKEATMAAAPRATEPVMPRDNAIRVVTGAQALAPNLGQRMMAVRLLGKAVVMRELMPQDLKLDAGKLNEKRAMALAAYLGAVVGKAHGRQLPADDRRHWLGHLVKARRTTLEAPSWLWTSVVDLLGIHERAYLEHCRLFALGSRP